ncbi:MAG: DUF3579 domain-containing protein [Pseudomonadota bacterium]
MSSDLPKFVIEGITVDGMIFRPSDWIERLIDTVASYGADRRTRPGSYSGPDRRRQQVGFLRAQMIEGRKCLVVDARLQEANPAAFRFLQEFIQSNRLRMLETDSTIPITAASSKRI